MLGVVLILVAAVIWRFLIRPAFLTIHPLYAARMLDQNETGLDGSLLALVDLQASGRVRESSIHKALEKRAAVRLTEIHVDEAIDRRMLMRLGTGNQSAAAADSVPDTCGDSDRD
jgi:hypothetical protein